MLDIHPAQRSANSWKEFFVHIATIVIGLLIAVGLEQTVEYFHHRHLAREARASIQRELTENVSIVQGNNNGLIAEERSLTKDLELLDSGTSDAQTLQALQYSWDLRKIEDAAWSAARIDGSIALIPSHDIGAADYFYSSNSELIPLVFAYFTDIDTASAVLDHCRAIGKLPPQERDQLRTLTVSAMGRANVFLQILPWQLRAIAGTDLDPH
jgi:plasmid maintenance system antidote protein VapI